MLPVFEIPIVSIDKTIHLNYYQMNTYFRKKTQLNNNPCNLLQADQIMFEYDCMKNCCNHCSFIFHSQPILTVYLF